MLGLCILELFATYAMDKQTDGWTKATHKAPFPMIGAIIKNLLLLLLLLLVVYVVYYY